MREAKDKQTLDAIGKTLISRAALSDAELDVIVSKPDLFAGVTSRISTQERVTTQRFTLKMGLAYVSVSLAVAVVATIAAVTFLRTSPVQQASVVQVPVAQPETPAGRPDSPPQDYPEVSPKLTAGRPDQRINTAYREDVPAPQRNMNPRPAAQPAMDSSDFYAVSSTDGDSLAGGRIVRVDMSRAQAFAMGIRLPLENDSETVKADLLVGPDGVPRAVRLVR